MLDIYMLRLIIINITIIFKHSCFNITAQKIVGIGCDLNLISIFFFNFYNIAISYGHKSFTSTILFFLFYESHNHKLDRDNDIAIG